jgi:class 3 adenylate cyclase
MVGSTRLVQRLGDRWPVVLQSHLTILRDAASQFGGVEMHTDGDALMLAFADASSAVQSAIEMQRRMALHDWPADVDVAIRIAVHSGDVHILDNDYVGLPLHVAARVRSATHGGQIIITEATRQLVAEVETLDLGDHRLKDLPSTNRLHQVVATGLAKSFPPPITLTTLPNNLPIETDSSVGRRHEVVELTKALGTWRLVTLTGMGGTGKTRLALHTSAELAAHY